MSVRFLGRRVYLALAVVLGLPGMPGRPSGGAAVRNPERFRYATLERWRHWWQAQFP
jgi:hypothetical protein